MEHTYIYHDHLETSRLYTRFLTPEDVSVWKRFFKDEDAIAFLIDDGFNTYEEKATHWMYRQLQRYKDNRYGLQALIHRQTNEFIGQCGLLLQEVDGIIETEVGYHILKQYWGQGFAPEAARCFIRFAFDNNLSNSVISIIDRNNVKSQRVAEKNGLKREKQTRWNNREVYIYRIHQSDGPLEVKGVKL